MPSLESRPNVLSGSTNDDLDRTMRYYSIVRCPVCKGVLTQASDLHCSSCKTRYPIVDGIPVMLSDHARGDGEQDLVVEKKFYEDMFSGLKGLEDGHCIVYGHERIYDFMDGVERGALLEAGCGAGHHGVSLSKRGFQVTSIDLTLNGVRAAQKLAQHEHQDILYVCGDIKRLPFADNEFDICFCSLILHHFIALDNLLTELARVTKKCFVAFEVNAFDPLSCFRFNIVNPTFGYWNISSNQRALFPGRIQSHLRHNGFKDFAVKYEDMHDNLGRHPDTAKAKMILAYQTFMKIFPEKYSKNKFLIRATK